MQYTEHQKLPRTTAVTDTTEWLTRWNAWTNQHSADASTEMVRITAAACGMHRRQVLPTSYRTVCWTF